MDKALLPIFNDGKKAASMLNISIKPQLYALVVNSAKELDSFIKGPGGGLESSLKLAELMSNPIERKKDVQTRVSGGNYDPIFASMAFYAFKDSGYVRPVGQLQTWHVLRFMDTFAIELADPKSISKTGQEALKRVCLKISDYLSA
jgi:hypothetical protein